MYARWFRPAALLRRKLTLLLGVLESRTPESRHLERAPHGRLRFALGVAARAGLSVLAATLLLPVLALARLTPDASDSSRAT